MQKIITTVGRSLFDNYREYHNAIDIHYDVIKDKPISEWRNVEERLQKVKGIVTTWANGNTNASAEIRSIVKIQEMLKDDIAVYLFATDTVISRFAAEIIRAWFENYDQKIEVMFDETKDVISALQVGNYERLIREGLPNLINRINWIAGVGTDSPGYFDNMLFNITGGYKAVIPYMTIMAQVNGCKIAYIFEDMDSLILIQPLPVKIDFEIFETYSTEIAWLDEGIENYQQAKNLYFQKFTELEQKGLVEQIDNLAMLSPIGRIFYERFKRKVFLFYAPDDMYSELNTQKDIIRILRSKFTNKQHRESKTEKKVGHYVYDDGDNRNRIYYFIDKGNCYIYKTFQSEEDARKFIDTQVDKNKIMRESKLRKLEVSHV